jgi:alkanesulfonate monooxygenase SsuD/methylene tetrahydromethanopterin reductase-like flavin-dependent oxidoreductase (luciferase family)
VPIYVAALGPRNLELTGELADGWIGNTFMPEHARVFLDRLAAGAARAGRRLTDLDLVIPVAVEFTEDTDAAEAAARRHAAGYAFTIGAMGSRDQNFYNAALTRQGFGDDVRAVQELWLAGQRDAAAARVPAEIGRATNLLGTPAMVAERLRLYRDVGITTLQAKLAGDYAARLDTLAQLIELVRQVSSEPGADGR